MIVECPACNTIFPVDPKKVPTGGIDARCSVCSEVFFVAPPEPEAEVFEPAVEDIEPEVAAPEPELPEGLVEAEAEPAVEEELPPVIEADLESETNFEVEVEPIEVEPSIEDQVVSLGTEAVPEFDEGLEPGYVPEPTLEPEPVFETAEATFEEVEESVVEATESVVEAAESIPAEVDDMAEEFTATADTETTEVEVVEEVTEIVEELPEGPTISAPVFGKRDPMEKAQRLARVLVSDIILYNPDRHHAATETGRVKEEFEEEIQKSWSEYVEQVGEEVADNTPYFNDALNEILAKGEKIF